MSSSCSVAQPVLLGKNILQYKTVFKVQERTQDKLNSTTERMTKMSSSDVELNCMAEVDTTVLVYFLMYSSDKVLLNPYTQVKVLSMLITIVFVVYLHHG